MTHAPEHGEPGAGQSHADMNLYPRLVLMAALSFIAMYVLMYAMVDDRSNVYHSLNQVYMAGLMTAAMIIIELVLMRAMYRNRRINAAILVGSAVGLIACWFLIRGQRGIADRQFLRSMIPHHAGAILMCQQAPIQDVRVRQLCQNIITSQQQEIDLMKAMLRDLR